MKSAAWLLALTLFVVLLSCGAYFFLTGKLLLPKNEVTVSRSEDLSSVSDFVEVPLAVDTEKKDSSAKERYAYNVHFPTIALASHPDLANEANAVVVTFVNDVITNFKTHIIELYSPLVPDTLTSDLSMRWSTELLSPTIISIRFDYSEYIAGSAHPNSRSKVLNYDIEKHLILHTTDLFASSSEALPFLSEVTREELKKRSPNISDDELTTMLIPGTEATGENFTEVAIDSDGLIVIFNPVQVAPYARGSQDVHVPEATSGLHLAPRVEEAIRLGNSNIIEATPEGTP